MVDELNDDTADVVVERLLKEEVEEVAHANALF